MTHDCCTKYSTNDIIKYADDATVMYLIQDDEEQHYRKEVKLFLDWWRKNNMILDAKKTKELVVDFRNKQPMCTPFCFCGDCAMHEVPGGSCG